MSTTTQDRLFGIQNAFNHPATIGILVFVLILLAAAPTIYHFLGRAGRLTASQMTELWQRYFSWLVLAPSIAIPILLGAVWTMGGVAILSLLCFREYARATGLFREKLISWIGVVGIFGISFAALDNWYYLFVAMFPLTVAALTALPVLTDQPHGYIQRVALGVFGFSLFGAGLGHLGFMANDANYRPLLLLVLTAVQLNDIAAFVIGRWLGRRPLAPHTSPQKTIVGAVAALAVTIVFVNIAGQSVFANTPLENPVRLILLGIIISLLAQFGDLVLSSIKRDLGLKEMSAALPGHGGLLDRFDSLLLVAPAVFHYVNYVVGIGLDQPICIFSGARGH
jgi:phosphatidate cytidylyltransferase